MCMYYVGTLAVHRPSLLCNLYSYMYSCSGYNRITLISTQNKFEMKCTWMKWLTKQEKKNPIFHPTIFCLCNFYFLIFFWLWYFGDMPYKQGSMQMVVWNPFSLVLLLFDFLYHFPVVYFVFYLSAKNVFLINILWRQRRVKKKQ